MASLALGLAGAAVGSFFGPLGASIGWGLGAAVGARLFAKGTHGPRLTDNKVQTASYGEPIPIGYATIRVSGKIMWRKPRTEHKKKSSGKGGPKVTEYSYTQSYAVELLETSFLQDGALVNNPIVGILNIWNGGDLIYGEGSPGTVLPMTVYYGTEDQEPDPTMEAAEGVGNVPAYRGIAYVVFDETDLILPNNLTFEIVASGSIQLELYAQWPVDYDYPIDGSAYSYPYIFNGTERLNTEQLALHRYRSGNDYGPVMGTADDNVLYYNRKIYDLKGNFVSADDQVTAVFGGDVRVFGSLNSGIAYAEWQETIDCQAQGGDEFTTANNFAWLNGGVVTYTNSVFNLCLLAGGADTVSDQLPIDTAPVSWNGFVYAAGPPVTSVGDIVLRRWEAPDGSVYVHDPDTISFNADEQRTGYPAAGSVADSGDIIIGDDGCLYWLVGYSGGVSPDGIRLFKLTAELELLQTWWTGNGASLPTPTRGSSTIYRSHIIAWHELAPGNYYFTMERLNSDGSTTFVAQLESPPPAPAENPITPVHYIGGGLAAFRGGILKLGSDGVPLSDIVANVSQHMGYADTEYDVEQLTPIVRGYCIGNRMSGRSAIEALQPVYQFGAVESNLQAKFVLWTGEVMESITADYLGARDDSSDPVEPLTISRVHEKDLPRQIEAVFINHGMDYQDGTQYSKRTTTYSDLDVPVNFPVVLTDTEAKARVDALHYNAWIERDSFKFSLPRKFAYWEPTDVHDINGYAVRITNKDEQGYTHINFEGLRTRTNVFVTAPVAPPPLGFVPQAPLTLNKTDLLLLDLPLVADSDFKNGHYAAIAGRMDTPWPGAAVFKSVDGGVNYNSIYAAVDPDTFGVATTAIADWTGGNVFDESSTVTVRLTPGSGELASSNELGVLNGANRAMLGDEMISFKIATLTATRTYVLSGLLRGRRGTEWATADHVVDEEFVLLPCHNIEGPGSELGQSRKYKAVTQGGLLSGSTAIDFTNNGIALKPYAPVLLGGGRNAAGDITLTWVRRTRIGGAWTDNIDVPLSEAIEFYHFIAYSDGTYTTIIREGDVAVQTLTYTAALQITDYGSPQATLYWGVKQLGAYGYGYEARGVT